MNITWHGNSLFRILVQKDRNGSVDIATNPFSKETGLKPGKMKADILLLSNEKFLPFSKDVSGEPFLVSSPGEYEIKEVFIRGIGPKNGEILYVVEAEGINICFLGEIKEKELKAEEIDMIGDIDILMIPVGGGTTIDSKGAAQIIAQIEPRIVVPMNYKVPGLKEKKESVEAFLKAMGLNSREKTAKLSIKKKDISPEGETEVIILECK